MSKPKVVVVIAEGILSDVYATEPIELVKIDCDTEWIGDYEDIFHLTDLGGGIYSAYCSVWSKVGEDDSPKEAEHLYNQIYPPICFANRENDKEYLTCNLKFRCWTTR